jgi:hypothetical protein
MITLQQFFETFDYRITEGSEYMWSCYGDNAHQLSTWNGVHGDGGWSGNIVFDTKTQTVYEVDVCDYTRSRAYRLINVEYQNKYQEEAKTRSVLANQAWDEVNFTDLETEEDWLEKASAIVVGEDYDTRVQIPLNLDTDILFRLMQRAHEHDITLNQMVEKVMVSAIDEYKQRGEHDFN